MNEVESKNIISGEPEVLLTMAGTKSVRSILMFIFSSLGPFFSAVNVLSYQFLGATPQYWCQIDGLNSTNFTWNELRNLSLLPLAIKGEDMGCKMYDIDYAPLANMNFEEARSNLDALIQETSPDIIECRSRMYEPIAQTIVTKWDLVCDRRYLYSTVQAAVQGGLLVGSIFFGYLNDKFGRLFIYKLCVILYLITGLLTAASHNVGLFLILKLTSSTFGMGYYISGMMLAMEHCLAHQRSLIANYYVLPWAFGMMAVSGIAYYIRPWYYLQIALTIPAAILVPNFWLLLESPRWLIMQRRFDEAYEVHEKLANSSKRSFPSREVILPKMKEWTEDTMPQEVEEGNWIERIKDNLLFVMSPLRLMFKKTLGIFFCWFAVSLVYYGVALGSTTLSADEYLYMLIGGALEVPSYLILWPMAAFLGRKKSLILLFFISGVSILAVMGLILTEYDNFSLKMTLYLLGKFAITAVFHLLWVYTAELYPTKFRTLAVGEASSAARLGSICSPYINDLLYEKAFYSPSALFGTFSMLAGATCFMFPETKNRNLVEATESEQDIISISDTKRRRSKM